eukprot:1921026-Pyramimonas_sp.AAC.1
MHSLISQVNGGHRRLWAPTSFEPPKKIGATRARRKDPRLLTRLKKFIQEADNMEQPPTRNAVLVGRKGLA